MNNYQQQQTMNTIIPTDNTKQKTAEQIPVLYRIDALESLISPNKRAHRYAAARAIAEQVVTSSEHFVPMPALFWRTDLNGVLPKWTTDDWAKKHKVSLAKLLWTASIYVTEQIDVPHIRDYLEETEKYDFIGGQEINFVTREKLQKIYPKTGLADILSGNNGVEEDIYPSQRIWDFLVRLLAMRENNFGSDGCRRNGRAFIRYRLDDNYYAIGRSLVL